jgi:(p)ppGpp synthase/HD superfamily hydrolase
VDKAGAPYILHPLRVMLKLEKSEERIAAVLHDVVEDSEITLEHLRNEGFSDAVVDAIDAVTMRHGESYDDFVRRAALNSIGRHVKLADLEDNSDLSRIANPTEVDYERLAKYQRAIESISSISRG